MKSVRRFFIRFGPMFLMWGLIGAFLVVLLGFRLESALPQLSQSEINATQQVASIDKILDNPLFAPHKLGQLALIKSGYSSPLAMRAVSGLYAVLVLIVFYRILRTWFTFRIALTGSLLLACSSWFLHVARLATPEIMLAGVVVLPWCGLLFRSQKSRLLTLVLCTFLVATICYVPGAILFVAASLIWQRRNIIKELNKMSVWFSSALLIAALGLLLPLLLAIVRQPDIGRQLLGLPAQFELIEIGRNLLKIPSQLVWHGLDRVDVWLPGTPLLDIFSLAMLTLGVYAMVSRLNLDRTRLLIGLTVGSLLLVSLGGQVTISLLLPFIYLLIASGVTLLLQYWFTVFPKNPVARDIGIGLLGVAIGLSCLYNLGHYFVAWPKTPETKSTFSQPVSLQPANKEVGYNS